MNVIDIPGYNNTYDPTRWDIWPVLTISVTPAAPFNSLTPICMLCVLVIVVSSVITIFLCFSSSSFQFHHFLWRSVVCSCWEHFENVFELLLNGVFDFVDLVFEWGMFNFVSSDHIWLLASWWPVEYSQGTRIWRYLWPYQVTYPLRTTVKTANLKEWLIL